MGFFKSLATRSALGSPAPPRRGRAGPVRAGIDFGAALAGDKELAKSMRRLDAKLAKNGMRQAMRTAMRPVLASARVNAAALTNPANLTDRMMRVAQTMRIRALRTRRRGLFGITVETGTRPALGVDEDSRWYYPAHVELGSHRTPPMPYMRPALLENRARSLEIFRTELAGFIGRNGRG